MAQKQGSRLIRIVIFVCLLIGGVLFGLVIGNFLKGDGVVATAKQAHPNLKYWMLLSLPFQGLLAIAVHELGHVFAGLTVNFEFQSLYVGCFKVEKRQGRLMPGWNFSINKFGGLALMLPTNSDNLKNRFSWFVAGGPLASLLLVLVCFGFAAVLPKANVARLFLQTIGFFSLAIAVATAIPLPSGKGFRTDGRRILDLQRNAACSEVELATLTAVAHLSANHHPKVLDIQQIDRALSATDQRDLSVSALHYFKYLYWLANGDADRAELSLKEYIDTSTSIPRVLKAACGQKPLCLRL